MLWGFSESIIVVFRSVGSVDIEMDSDDQLCSDWTSITVRESSVGLSALKTSGEHQNCATRSPDPDSNACLILVNCPLFRIRCPTFTVTSPFDNRCRFLDR